MQAGEYRSFHQARYLHSGDGFDLFGPATRWFRGCSLSPQALTATRRRAALSTRFTPDRTAEARCSPPRREASDRAGPASVPPSATALRGEGRRGARELRRAESPAEAGSARPTADDCYAAEPSRPGTPAEAAEWGLAISMNWRPSAERTCTRSTSDQGIRLKAGETTKVVKTRQPSQMPGQHQVQQVNRRRYHRLAPCRPQLGAIVGEGQHLQVFNTQQYLHHAA